MPKIKPAPIQSDNQWFRVRLATVYVVLVGFLVLVIFRLAQLQIIHNPVLSKMAKKQFERPIRKKNLRLPIFDRKGNELAVNSTGGSIYAHPQNVTQRSRASRILAKHLGGKPKIWRKRLKSKKKFVWIKRLVPKKTADAISKAKLEGVHVAPAMRRIYPNGMVASNVLGFVGVDGDGLSGMELALNDQLKVTKQSMSSVYGQETSPVESRQDGTKSERGVFLTLDLRLQHLVEAELDRTMKKTGAKAVYAIVMDPATGELLSFAQRPSFEPNRRRDFSPRTYANRSISYLHEPGSTMKVLLAAESIERKIYEPGSQINCENGRYKIGRKTIREADTSHRFQLLSLSDVITYSSNVGSAKIAQKLGPSKVRAALHRFGFMKKLQTGLPGEASIKLRPIAKWTPLLTATAGFGQGIAVTPLHMVRAFAMIANGGYLVQPTLIKGQSAKQVRGLSSDTAKKITDMLVQVTEAENGTGKMAQIPGVQVAGKTGTAQKYKRGKGYRSGKYFSSFIGFAPAEDPKVVVGVFVDEPEKKYYASEVAAPAFKQITKSALLSLDRMPPRLVDKNLPHPESPPAFQPKWVNAGDADSWRMPDFSGRSLRTVLRELSPKTARVHWKGQGYVARQSPKPGAVLTRKSRVKLVLN